MHTAELTGESLAGYAVLVNQVVAPSYWPASVWFCHCWRSAGSTVEEDVTCLVCMCLHARAAAQNRGCVCWGAACGATQFGAL